jgi:hypothetical protein
MAGPAKNLTNSLDAIAGDAGFRNDDTARSARHIGGAPNRSKP